MDRDVIEMNDSNSFENLVRSVSQIHCITSDLAKSSVNQLLTMRNWAIGHYIVEFEQHGLNRAEYGSRLLSDLAAELNIKGLDRTVLGLCRTFDLKYPQIRETASHKLKRFISEDARLELPAIEPHAEGINECSTPDCKFVTDPEVLISRLSFSHIREIMKLEDPFERFFYEFECIQGVWSVRELKRQIATNLYFRAGISRKPEILLERIRKKDLSAELTLKDPFALEFLGLSERDAVEESDVESAWITHFQEFLLELGRGFCLEERKKRILIDDVYYYPDLIFYHRYLHCNVVVELKVHEFRHEDLGQLNAYVAYYKKNEMVEGDSPPIGILLCTDKGPQMVEYALSGMDNQLFVSSYMLHLPDKKELEEFLLKQMKDMGI